MDYKKLNEALTNLDNASSNPNLKLVERVEIRNGVDDSYGDGVQGEENVYDIIYKIVGSSDEDPYIKITYFTDSYGYGSFVRSVQFVYPTTKTVKVFETI